MDLSLRKVRYFVAVAEELHFGRAAERLHIAQPVLSRQIRALETELHAQLFRRDRRSTELTAAGRQLLDDARPLLTAADALRHRVRRAAGEPARFTVGFMPGITVTDAVRAMAARHPGITLDVVRTSWDDQTRSLLDGRADVSFVRMPLDQRGLRLRPLYSEPRVAVVPAGHRLSGRESIGLADLAGERPLQDPDAVPEWREIPVPPDARSGDARRFPRAVEEKLEYVASCEGVVILPRSVATFYTRPDVTHVPVRDITPHHVALAWSAGNSSPLVDEFAALVVEFLALPAADRAPAASRHDSCASGPGFVPPVTAS
ncbi:LysR family transcriptional regulator [Streptomyces luteireticuli]|uniref:LysR family transcriptional regulator n=1 Tax=Streptomyces luteireticuli TaxID=173858 RepID=UPI0035587CAC